MSNFEDRLEASEARVSAERATKIAKAAAALSRRGTVSCQSCGDPIPAERRKAMPSARRCIDCQTFAYRRRKAR